jgi:integrase
MATCLFRSPLAYRLQGFLEARQQAGRRSIAHQKLLLYLDRFLVRELRPGETITREIAERWIQSLESLSIGSRGNQISILRQFCLYLAHFDPRTCVVHRSFLPRRNRLAPHIYSRKEVRQIMAATERIGPCGSLRPAVVANVVGLLYATGLRIGEALKLTLGDVDLQRRVLLVRETKFYKSRHVPLSCSVTTQLQAYVRQRRGAGFSTAADSPFFVNLRGRRYGPSGFTALFVGLLRKIGLRGPRGQRGPRVHDLRHSFAVSRLLAWYREGANLSAKLPLLSIYLGHSTVTCTEVYLHATAELLERAGQRFHSHFVVPPLSKKRTHV